jgi:hypothetical protein
MGLVLTRAGARRELLERVAAAAQKFFKNGGGGGKAKKSAGAVLGEKRVLVAQSDFNKQLTAQ